MEKRLILAMALSLLLLSAWSAMIPKPQYVENKEVRDTSIQAEAPFEKPSTSLSSLPSAPDTNVIDYQQEKYEISFIESLAAIESVRFKEYQEYAWPLQYAFLLKDKPALFTKHKSDAKEVSFAYVDESKKIIKKYIFYNNSYSIGLELSVKNLTEDPITENLSLVLGVLQFSPKDANARYQDVIVGKEGKTLHVSPKKNAKFQGVNFLGLRDRYFCAVIESQEGAFAVYTKKIDSQNFEIGLDSGKLTLSPGQEMMEEFHIYLGPQELEFIRDANPNWASVIHFGTFDFISQILLQLLRFLYGIVHNWGLAIVILSIAVYLILFPLTVKQMRSMKEMQALQPHIMELKKLYKDNPQRMQKEQMELFRKHKVNPFGGCLPLLLQMPIFFALYQTLMRSVFLRGANFLWIKDLSGPDKLFALPFPKPFDYFNLLPILMAIGMFIQQKATTASTAGSASADQQKIMMFMMPLLFGFIFYSMPAGLVLYWFINSTLMLLNQVYQLRANPKK